MVNFPATTYPSPSLWRPKKATRRSGCKLSVLMSAHHLRESQIVLVFCASKDEPHLKIIKDPLCSEKSQPLPKAMARLDM